MIINFLIFVMCVFCVYELGKSFFINKKQDLFTVFFLLLNTYVGALCLRDFILEEIFNSSIIAGFIMATIGALGFFQSENKFQKAFWFMATSVGVIEITSVVFK